MVRMTLEHIYDDGRSIIPVRNDDSIVGGLVSGAAEVGC